MQIESTFDLSEDEYKRVKLHADRLFASWFDTSANDKAAVEAALSRMFERERAASPRVYWCESVKELAVICEEFGLNTVDRLGQGCEISLHCADPITKAFTRALSKANLTWPVSWQQRVMQFVGPQRASRWRESSARAGLLLTAQLEADGLAADWICWAKWNGDWQPIYALPALALASDDWAQDLLAQIADMFTLRTGAFAYAFAGDTVYACINPVKVNIDERDRLHSFDTAALQFADGYSLYAWNGVLVDPELVLHPESLTAQRIDKEENIELRRVMIDRYGAQRYLEESDAHVLAEDETGVLLQKEVPGDEPILMVKVINSTAEPDGTYKEYFLRVPPGVSSAREGVAWTFGLEPHEYNPSFES